MSTQPGVVPAGWGQSVLREQDGLLVLVVPPPLDADAALLTPAVDVAEEVAPSDVAALVPPDDDVLVPPVLEDAPGMLDAPTEAEPLRDDDTPPDAVVLLVPPLPLPGRDVVLVDVPGVEVPPLTVPPLLAPLATVMAHAPSTHCRPSLQSPSEEHRAAGSSCAHPDRPHITTMEQAAPRILQTS